jgi:heme exporter protein B
MKRLFLMQFKRELLLQSRQIHHVVNFCLFFLMVLLLFPLTLKPDSQILHLILPGLVWVSLLLSLLLCAERMFLQDYEHGVIEQWLTSGQSLSILVAAKVWAHWLLHIAPILLFCPLIALIFSLSSWALAVLLLSLLCATPCVLFLCALSASLGVGIQQKGALMALIVLPLTLPVLVFGSGVIHDAMSNLPVHGVLACLLAFSVLSATLLPYVIAGVIRVTLVD